MAIEVILPDSGRVEVTDTFRPRARALNGLGDSVAAQVFWSSFDSTVLEVLDSATGVSLAQAVGNVELQARVGALRSNPQIVAVLAQLDTLLLNGPDRNTVFAPDSVSDSLVVRALAIGGEAVSRRVVYAAVTYPPGGSTFTFVPKDTVFTNSTGVAAVQLRFRAGMLPDSVVVTAAMRRLDGTQIAGSPVTFVVEF